MKSKEYVFDIGYLISGMIMSVWILYKNEHSWSLIYGLMSLLLIFGDSFHLIPRIRANSMKMTDKLGRQLAMGKLITSVTMTGFYVILWHAGIIIGQLSEMMTWTVVIWTLAGLRILLCLIPANRWFDKEPSYKWAIYRNIPFTLLGVAVMVQFMLFSGKTEAFALMWFAIFLSFVFYLPVVLWGNKKPMLGMLMLPKSCVYLWIIAMGI